MGYSHWWKQPYEIERPVWGRMLTDCRRLLSPLQEAGVVLADGCGQGAPLMDLERISLNGAARCGHLPGEPPFLRVLEQVGPDGFMKQMRSLPAGEMWQRDWEVRRCPGLCVFETFEFCRVQVWEGWHSCKTNRRHYDLAVTSFLIVAKRYLGDSLELEGMEALWFESRLLCQQHLGYGLDLPLFPQPA